MAVGQTEDGGATGFIVDKRDLTEGLTHRQLGYLIELAPDKVLLLLRGSA